MEKETLIISHSKNYDYSFVRFLRRLRKLKPFAYSYKFLFYP